MDYHKMCYTQMHTAFSFLRWQHWHYRYRRSTTLASRSAWTALLNEQTLTVCAAAAVQIDCRWLLAMHNSSMYTRITCTCIGRACIGSSIFSLPLLQTLHITAAELRAIPANSQQPTSCGRGYVTIAYVIRYKKAPCNITTNTRITSHGRSGLCLLLLWLSPVLSELLLLFRCHS